MNLQSSKKLGIIGVLLIFLDVILTVVLSVGARFLSGWSIPTFGIIRIIGIIVILLSLRNLADFYQTKTIYTNAKMGAAVAIMGMILTIPSGIVLSQLMANTPPILTAITGLLLTFIIITVFLTISAFFVSRSLNELATCSGIDEFASAGKFLFIGAILTIILFGVIFIGIAFLMLLTAFSALKETKRTPSPYTTENIPPPLNAQTKFYCAYCGTPVLPEATFCTRCGKQI
jgi:uncharacterized membrane protein